MTWPRHIGGSRLAVAQHEAGHAVVAHVLGRSFRYVSLRPRNPEHAGHVLVGGGAIGDWLVEGAICSAGILAEGLGLAERHGWFYGDSGSDLVPLHRHLTRHCGRDDLRDLRDCARRVWRYAVTTPGEWLAEPIDPHWRSVDLAEVCWRYAAATVVARWEAIGGVADALCGSPRALTQRQVGAIVDGVRPDPDAAGALPEEWARPWFLDHSRLKWDASAQVLIA